jgi:hypothetical protein
MLFTENVSAVVAQIPATRPVDENTLVKSEPSREFWQVSNDEDFVSEVPSASVNLRASIANRPNKIRK